MPARHSVGKFSPSSTSLSEKVLPSGSNGATQPSTQNLGKSGIQNGCQSVLWRHQSIRIDDFSAQVSSLVQVSVLEIKRTNVIILLYKQSYVSVIISAVLGLTWTVEA